MSTFDDRRVLVLNELSCCPHPAIFQTTTNTGTSTIESIAPWTAELHSALDNLHTLLPQFGGRYLEQFGITNIRVIAAYGKLKAYINSTEAISIYMFAYSVLRHATFGNATAVVTIRASLQGNALSKLANKKEEMDKDEAEFHACLWGEASRAWMAMVLYSVIPELAIRDG